MCKIVSVSTQSIKYDKSKVFINHINNLIACFTVLESKESNGNLIDVITKVT